MHCSVCGVQISVGPSDLRPDLSMDLNVDLCSIQNIINCMNSESALSYNFCH